MQIETLRAERMVYYSGSYGKPSLEFTVVDEDEGGENDSGCTSFVDVVDDNDQETRSTTSEGSAPDGGWGWCVVTSCFLLQILQAASQSTSGVVYVKMREVFDCSSVAASLVGAVNAALPYFLSHVATSLSSMSSVRVVVFIGGLTMGTSTVLCGFAPNVGYMIVMQGVGFGVGGALSYSPCLILVNQYFRSRRALANGIAATGGGIAGFAAPPLLDILFNTYGFSGGFFIFGALLLNSCGLAGLLRPLPRPRTLTKSSPADVCSVCNELRGETSLGDIGPVTDGASNAEKSHDVCRLRGHAQIQRETTNSSSKCLNCFESCQLINKSFVTYAIGLALVTQSSIASLQLLVDYAREVGILNQNAVFLLAVSGIFDTVGRLLIGMFFDLPAIVRCRRYLYCAISIACGCVILTTGFVHEYKVLIIICSCHGLLRGAIASQRAAILVDMYGPKNLPFYLGLCLSCIGLSIFVGPVLAGLLRDLFGFYTWSFVFNGLSSVTGGVMMMTSMLMLDRTR